MDLTEQCAAHRWKHLRRAAGLPILPGLVRYDEVEAGEIRHALRFTIPKTQRLQHVWPARHDACNKTDANLHRWGFA